MIKNTPYASKNFLCSLRQDAVLPPDDIRKEACELISSISNTTYEDCHKNTQNFYEEIEKYKDCCLGVGTYLVGSSLPFNVDKNGNIL